MPLLKTLRRHSLIITLFFLMTLPTLTAYGQSSIISSKDDVLKVLNNILTFVYIVFFILAAMFILFAAYSFLTAAGDEQKVRDARNKLLYAVIAIIVALISMSASGLIRNFIDSSVSAGTTPSSIITSGGSLLPPSDTGSSPPPVYGGFGSDCSLDPSVCSGGTRCGIGGTCQYY